MGRIRLLLQRIHASSMVKQAAWIFGFNTLAKGLTFLGTAYAAKCLGPVNLGISALVYSLCQLIVLLTDGGLNTVAVRRIAADASRARALTGIIIRFRAKLLLCTLPLGLVLAFVLTNGANVLAWLAGAGLAIATSLSLLFVFQGLEKLPVQGKVNVLTSGLAAIAFCFFQPGMPPGSDLAVTAVVGLIGLLVSAWILKSLLGDGADDLHGLSPRALLVESRPYWLLNIIIFCYSTLQLPLVGYICGQRELGIYRSALMLSSGLELFYASINSLLLPRFVIWGRHGLEYLWSRQKMLAGVFLVLGSAVSVVVICVAPLFYRRFFGVEFHDAIVPFQILVIGRMVVFVGQIYIWSLAALNLDRDFLVATSAGAFFSVCASIIFISRFGIIAAAIISVLTELIIFVVSFIIIRSRVDKLRMETVLG